MYVSLFFMVPVWIKLYVLSAEIINKNVIRSFVTQPVGQYMLTTPFQHTLYHANGCLRRYKRHIFGKLFKKIRFLDQSCLPRFCSVFVWSAFLWSHSQFHSVALWCIYWHYWLVTEVISRAILAIVRYDCGHVSKGIRTNLHCWSILTSCWSVFLQSF